MKMDNIVLDSWALIAFFDNEPAAMQVEDIITEAHANNLQMMISVINLGELWYSYARIYSDSFADDLIEKVKVMKIEVKPVDWNIAKIAAGFKKEGGISYADCFAGALASKMDAALVTGDPEFSRLEDHISIMWI